MTCFRSNWQQNCYSLVVTMAVTLSLSGCGGGGGGTATTVGQQLTAPTGLSYAVPDVLNVGSSIDPLLPLVSGVVESFSVTPALPDGLSLDARSGQITGNPSASTASALYTVVARNSAGETAFEFSLAIAPALFSLEPGPAVTVGIGQRQNLFAPRKASNSDPYPVYVDPAQITWSSSQPGIAEVTANGKLLGVNEGSATIRADHQGQSAELSVRVAGIYEDRPGPVSGRRYALYRPPQESGGAPLPLILSLHGGFGNAANQASTSLLPAFAEQQGVYVAFLEGTGNIASFNAWNAGACCGAAQENDVDDVAYARAVLDEIEASVNIDPTQIYASGFSNGAMMTYRLACELSGRIVAVAAVGGGSAEFDQAQNQYYQCAPERPVPVLHIHAANDRNYPLAGGTGDGPGLPDTGAYAIDATLADWRDRNNVSDSAVVSAVTPTTSCSEYRTTQDSALPSAPVVFCLLDPPDVYDAVNGVVFGGGHSWPGGVRGGSNGDVPDRAFNTNQFMWSFFQE